MNAVGDAIATLFTFLMFILLIVFPMLMAFVQAKKDRRTQTARERGSARTKKETAEEPRETRSPLDRPKKSKEKPKRTSAAKRGGGLFSTLELLRQQNRESEPSVSFTEGTERAIGEEHTHNGRYDREYRPPSSSQGKQEKREAREHRSSQRLGKKFSPLEEMPNNFHRSLSQISDTTQYKAARAKRAALPQSAAVSRLRELNEMQRAILLSEILGPPKGLQ